MSQRSNIHARAGLVAGLALLQCWAAAATYAQVAEGTGTPVQRNAIQSYATPAAPFKSEGDDATSAVRGDDAATITALQAALMVQNCFSSSIDGKLGETTVVAIERYRKAAGAGFAGPLTAAVLLDTIRAKPDVRCPTPLTRPTDQLVDGIDDSQRVALIRSIQVKLQQHGCSPGKLDGRYGKSTRAALRRALGRSAAAAEPSRQLLARLDDVPPSKCAPRSKAASIRPASKKRTARIETKPARRVRPKRVRSSRPATPPRIIRKPRTTRSATNRAACREYKRCIMMSGNEVKHSLGGICPSRPKGC